MQLPNNLSDERTLRIALEQIVRTIWNTTGTVTLNASTTTTVIANNKVNPNSAISLTPMTANAAAGLATTWVVPGNGQFVINHASATTANRTYTYSISGV